MARELEIKVTVDTATAEAALGRTEKAMENLGKEATKTGTALGTTDKKFQEAGRGASDFDGAIRSLALKLTGGAVLMKGLSLLGDSLLAVGRGLAGIGLNALDMNASLEKSTLQFTTLMGDSAKAEAHVRSLFEFAKKTPFETGPIIAASKHLQLFGGDALNSQKTLTLLGDAAAASGANIEELSFWTGRMYAAMQAGKPFGEAAMRLTELGVLTPQARLGLENLAATGASAADTFDLFQTSLGKFTGAMDMQASTWEGLTSTIRDSVNLTIADALEPFFEFTKAGASVLAQVLGSEGLQKTFNNVGKSIQASLGPNTASQVKTLMLGFVDFAGAVVVMADVAGRAFYAVKLAVQVVMQALAEFISIQINSIAGFTEMAASIPGVGRAFEGMNRILQDNRVFMQGVVDEARRQTSAAWDGVMGNTAYGKAMDGARTILDAMRVEISKATLAQNQATVATNAGADATRRLAEAAELDVKAMKARSKELEKFSKDMERFNNLSAQSRPIERIFDFRPDAGIKAFDELKKFQDSVKFFGLEAGKPWVMFKEAATKSIQDVVSSFDNFRGAFGNLGQTIVGAVQGGGNVFGSIGASLLGGLGKDLGQKLGNAIGGTLGSTLGSFGGPLGSIVGKLAGDLAGKLFNRLFGPSQQAQVRQMRDRFLEAAGGLDALRERAERAGVSMDRLMNARTTSEFQRAMDDFNRQLQAAEKHAAAVAAHIEKFNGELSGLLQSASEIGLILPDALNDTMQAMLESGQITGDTAELLRALGQGGEANFKAMENAAKKYGIELSALGPAFQQNKLDKTAGEIIDAFNVMTRGGADVTAVITGMSDEINKFVQEAVKSGRTVPENMRPILDKMLEQGQLTDENGEKLRDLSSIKFGAPIETAMDRLIKKIEELIDKFGKEMPQSFSAAASAGEKFAQRVGTAIEGIPDRIEFGNDTPGFDRGGVVGRHYRPPTSRDVIPALLRPGEVVLTPQQAASGLSGGGSTSVAVTINVAGYLDSSTARASLADVVKTELSKQLRREGRAA